MKRIYGTHDSSWPRMATALAVASMLTLSACGSSGASGGGESSGAEGKKVVYIWPDKEPFYTAVGCGAKDVAKRAGVNFSFSEPPKKFSPSEQIPVVDSVVAQHPDAIMVSAADAKALSVPLKQAAAAGIKVVTVSNNVDDTSSLTSAVVGDNRANGAKAADLLARRLKGKKGDVAYIAYTRGGSTITDDRQDGFEAEIKKYPNLHYDGPTVTNGNSGTGASATNAILSGHPKLVGIVGSYLPISTEMAASLRERHENGKVVALALDADTAGIDNIKNGSLAGLEAEPVREEGRMAMQQLINVFNGKPAQKSMSVQPVEFTKANYQDPKLAQYVPGSNC